MKHLQEFILERQNIRLPFTKKEMVDAYRRSKTDFGAIRDLIDANDKSGAFSYKAREVFTELLYAAAEADDSDKALGEFYDKIQSMPIDRLDITGYGCQGFVYRAGDSIVKIYYSGRLPKDIERLAEVNRSGSIESLPVIKRYGKSWYVRDSYDIGTDKCRRLMELLFGDEDGDVYDYSDCIYGRYLDGDIDPDELSEEERWAYDWLESVDTGLYKIEQGRYHISNADIVLKNIGEDKKGRIVLFDW